MSEMIERVAEVLRRHLERAAAENRNVYLDDPKCEGLARAAIEAMREPTGAMVSAACRVPSSGDVLREIAEMWRAMNETALKDR